MKATRTSRKPKRAFKQSKIQLPKNAVAVKKVGYKFRDANEGEKYRRRKFEGRTLQHFDLSNVRALCRLARKGNPIALTLAWKSATEFAQTILEIANTPPLKRVKQPRKMERHERMERVNHRRRLKVLKCVEKLARNSLYMPSVLSCSTSGNNETAKIVKGLKLSADCATGYRPNSRLDSLTTRFVVEHFEVFERTRTEIQLFARVYRKSRSLKKKFRTLKRYLIGNLALTPEDLRFLELGALNSNTVPDWWKNIFKPHLQDEFTMDEIRRTPLHKQLCAAQNVKPDDARKDYLVRNELKRRCEKALKNLAKSFDCSKPPSENT